MLHSRSGTVLITCALMGSVIMSGCSLLSGGGGKSFGGNRDHSDVYASAEEYCNYWYGPCEEVSSHTKERYDGSEVTVHEMRDLEFGFVYTATEVKSGYYLGESDFANYYIDEFIKSPKLEGIAGEYGLEFVNYGKDSPSTGPAFRINTDRELSAEDNKKILDMVIGALDSFDSERKVFNKPHDNISVIVSVWSAPWEHDNKTGARYHVEKTYFGDNYQEQ